MVEFIANVPGYLETASLYLSVLTVIATALVRLPIFASYQDEVAGVAGAINKVLHWMPTIGVNPKTKALAEKAKK